MKDLADIKTNTSGSNSIYRNQTIGMGEGITSNLFYAICSAWIILFYLHI